MQLDMSAPCGDWGETATKSFFTEGNFQITELWWGKSCPNSSLSIGCWALLSAGWWHTQQVHWLLCFAHVEAPHWHFWGVWHRGHSFVTRPSHPALSSTSDSHTSLSPHLFSFWNTSFPHSGFPLHWLDLLPVNLFYLWLQLSLMHSPHAAPLTMFYCFHVFGESIGQEKDAI